MAVYAISDTHFGHENCIRFRNQFSSIEEHDNFIFEKIMSRCGKRDSLYILGDVCLDLNSFHYVEEISRRVEFLHIVLGNHDMERKKSPTLQDYMKICKGIYGMKKYKSLWLSHSPMHPSELRGKINVHGHTHGVSIDDRRYVNVSCEAVNYEPINLVAIYSNL